MVNWRYKTWEALAGTLEKGKGRRELVCGEYKWYVIVA